MRRLVYTAVARQHVRSAIDSYNDQEPNLGARFVSALRDQARLLEMFPESSPRKGVQGAEARAVGDTATSTYHTLMRTTVTLDDDIYEAALSQARATGQRLGRVLSDMARQALQPGPPPKRTATRGGRFPGFEVPRGTRLIPASRIQKALDDDGVV